MQALFVGKWMWIHAHPEIIIYIVDFLNCSWEFALIIAILIIISKVVRY